MDEGSDQCPSTGTVLEILQPGAKRDARMNNTSFSDSLPRVEIGPSTAVDIGPIFFFGENKYLQRRENNILYIY